VKKYRVAILGSGSIGTDLLVKVLRSSNLTCVAFTGRSFTSPGMAKARTLGVPYSVKSIAHIPEHAGEIDLVFDATSSKDHAVHAPILKELGIRVIDLTPAKIGSMCIPAVNLDASLCKDN